MIDIISPEGICTSNKMSRNVNAAKLSLGFLSLPYMCWRPCKFFLYKDFIFYFYLFYFITCKLKHTSVFLLSLYMFFYCKTQILQWCSVLSAIGSAPQAFTTTNCTAATHRRIRHVCSPATLLPLSQEEVNTLQDVWSFLSCLTVLLNSTKNK